MINEKTSLLINRQVPEFVRDEHPKFIAFLEAYYEFLEKKQGTKKNDLTNESKKMRYLSDVDYSLEEFESNFFNTYASLMPIDVQVTKEILIKNVLPLYLAKGSEKSFKLLFRLLFDQDSKVIYPRDNILRASGGVWTVDHVLRIDKFVYQIITANGTNTTYSLIQEVGDNEIQIYFNGVLQYAGYYVRKESKQIIFDTAPSSNTEIRIYYTGFDFNLIKNRKITGKISGATSIIENIDRRTIAGANYYELFIDNKTLLGNFQNGELIYVDILDNTGILQELELQTLSDVKLINVIDGGASYNVGDPVIVRGTSTRGATAIVSEVASGNIENIDVLDGGAGFKLNSNVTADGYDTSAFLGTVQTIDSRGAISPNTITFFTDLITSIDFANTTIASLNYGFANVTNANVNTAIAVALTSNVQNVGPVTSVNVAHSYIVSGSNPTFNVAPINVAGNVNLVDLGIIGKVTIHNGGNNYVVGDSVTFTNQWDDFSGYGATAIVGAVDASGTITQVKITNGGLGYSKTKWPTLSVSSTAGTGANLSVYCLMDDGELLQGVLANYLPGQILNIKVLDAGAGYTVVPAIDLTQRGNKLATANAQIQDSYQTLPGKWTKADGLLSTEEIRIQGQEYYVNYSYVLSSKVEFNKYREIFKRLIHPTGFINHNEFVVDLSVQTPVGVGTNLKVSETISGLVNVNSSIYVIGTGTKFTNGVLTVGANVAINSQVKTIATIDSDTQFTVTHAFTVSSNNETLVITT